MFMNRLDPASTTLRSVSDARLAAISFVTDAVSRALDLWEIADNALAGMLSVMELDAGAVYAWQDVERYLQLIAARGLRDELKRTGHSIAGEDDATIEEVLAGKTLALSEIVAPTSPLWLGLTAAVAAPICAQGYVVGVLVLGSRQAREFSADDIGLIEVIANQIGNAMVHAQLQADLRASEEQYRVLVENSDDAIYIVDVSGQPRFANSAFVRVFGYTLEEFAQVGKYTRVHPDDVKLLQQAFQKLLHGEPVHNLEYRFCRKDGQWIELQCSAAVFSREGNQIRELQFMVREITEAKQRQQQLIRRNRQLAALTNLAEVANSTLNIEQIARNTLQAGLESTGMDGGCIHLVDSARRQISMYVSIGLPGELADQVRVVGWGEGVIGNVVNSGQTVIYGDLNAEAPTLLALAIKHGFRSLVVVPVKTRGEVLGAVCLISRRERSFTTDVVELVTAIGNQLGIALANAKLYARLVRENEKLNSVVYISSDSAQRLELEPLLKRIMIRAASLLKADAGYIVRFNNEAHDSEVVAATAPFEGLIGPRGPALRGLSGLVRDTRQGRIFTTPEIARFGHSPIFREVAVSSALVVPLMSRGEIMGTLTLVRKAESGNDFTREDLELMEAFAGRAAMAIDNAELLKDLQHKNRLLELLMDEAHHRIKNNLQMVSGLLQLQAETAEEGRAVEHLRTANARIQSIAQVHDLLSQDMPEKVDAHKLIRLITETLVNTVAAADNRPQVTLDVDQLWLSSEQAVALALIVNELVSNSLIHGRPPKGGVLQLKVQCRRDGSSVRLTISDNGGGFRDDGPHSDSPGQGLRIIAQLTQVNLRGRLEMGSRDNGVQADVRFDMATQTAPLPLPRPRASEHRLDGLPSAAL